MVIPAYAGIQAIPISPSRQTLEEHGALETVLELKRAGTIRFVGMSGTLPNLSDYLAMGVFDVFQIPYSAVEREHEALITAAAEAGAGIVIRGGAAKGAPTEGKQAGVQWERWQHAHLDNLLDGMTPMEFICSCKFFGDSWGLCGGLRGDPQLLPLLMACDHLHDAARCAARGTPAHPLVLLAASRT